MFQTVLELVYSGVDAIFDDEKAPEIERSGNFKLRLSRDQRFSTSLDAHPQRLPPPSSLTNRPAAPPLSISSKPLHRCPTNSQPIRKGVTGEKTRGETLVEGDPPDDEMVTLKGRRLFSSARTRRYGDGDEVGAAAAAFPLLPLGYDDDEVRGAAARRLPLRYGGDGKVGSGSSTTAAAAQIRRRRRGGAAARRLPLGYDDDDEVAAAAAARRLLPLGYDNDVEVGAAGAARRLPLGHDDDDEVAEAAAAVALLLLGYDDDEVATRQQHDRCCCSDTTTMTRCRRQQQHNTIAAAAMRYDGYGYGPTTRTTASALVLSLSSCCKLKDQMPDFESFLEFGQSFLTNLQNLFERIQRISATNVLQRALVRQSDLEISVLSREVLGILYRLVASDPDNSFRELYLADDDAMETLIDVLSALSPGDLSSNDRYPTHSTSLSELSLLLQGVATPPWLLHPSHILPPRPRVVPYQESEPDADEASAFLDTDSERATLDALDRDVGDLDDFECYQ
ncbi:hypothetical protein BDZ97DRAFT_1923555 [Flammula alnicola]|nr:hypothetical protein BDZ97DRAFT_1932516 [Flammula alnicola]KAF8958662.1 hypothetical protein BDZ97DRAFT_1923555 [Flammula alnicola]